MAIASTTSKMATINWLFVCGLSFCFGAVMILSLNLTSGEHKEITVQDN